jgi:hypothetical protein
MKDTFFNKAGSNAARWPAVRLGLADNFAAFTTVTTVSLSPVPPVHGDDGNNLRESGRLG